MSRDRTTLALERLPDKAQSIVCSLASTPSCPAHVLLVQVSKTWAAEASRQLQLDGASIELKLVCSPDSACEQQDREEQRLQGLAAWLQRNGHLLNGLHIETKQPQHQEELPEAKEECVLVACQVMPEVIAALAAAGGRRGGLRLQQLELPALPGTSMATICSALSGCRQLRKLHLDNSFSGQSTKSCRRALVKLAAALQQLTQLTCLELEGGLFRYCDQDKQQDTDTLFRALPSSLETLWVCGHYPGCVSFGISFHPTSLQHLTCLQRLTLPDAVNITADAGSGGSMAGSRETWACLAALTYLHCFEAISEAGAPLLALPNLVEVSAGTAMPKHLETLSHMAALRTLTFWLDPAKFVEVGEALNKLTHLTALTVYSAELVPEDEQEQEELSSLVQQVVAFFGGTLTSLCGLRSLCIEPLMLSSMDISPLTALTSLNVDCIWSQDWHTKEKMASCLHRLAPARGRLHAVRLPGLPAELQEGCREAAAAALGQVEVLFS